jgi:hypothetical protein
MKNDTDKGKTPHYTYIPRKLTDEDKRKHLELLPRSTAFESNERLGIYAREWGIMMVKEGQTTGPIIAFRATEKEAIKACAERNIGHEPVREEAVSSETK